MAGGVVQTLQPDQEDTAAYRGVRSRLRPPLREPAGQLRSGAAEERGTTLGEAAGHLLERAGPRIQGPDDLRQGGAQLAARGGDLRRRFLAGSSDLLLASQQLGDDADAPQTGAQLVVEIGGDPRPLALEGAALGGAQTRDGPHREDDHDRQDREEPPPPPDGRQAFEGERRRHGAGRAVLADRPHLEGQHSRRKPCKGDRPLARRGAPLLARAHEPVLIAHDPPGAEGDAEVAHGQAPLVGAERQAGQSLRAQLGHRPRHAGHAHLPDPGRGRTARALDSRPQPRHPVPGAEPEVPVFRRQRGAQPVAGQTVGGRQVTRMTGRRIEPVDAPSVADVDVTEPVLGEAAGSARGEAVLLGQPLEDRPRRAGVLHPQDGPLGGDPQPASRVEEEVLDEARRHTVGFSEQLEPTVRPVEGAGKAAVVEAQPQPPVGVFGEGGGGAGEIGLREPGLGVQGLESTVRTSPHDGALLRLDEPEPEISAPRFVASEEEEAREAVRCRIAGDRLGLCEVFRSSDGRIAVETVTFGGDPPFAGMVSDHPPVPGPALPRGTEATRSEWVEAPVLAQHVEPVAVGTEGDDHELARRRLDDLHDVGSTQTVRPPEADHPPGGDADQPVGLAAQPEVAVGVSEDGVEAGLEGRLPPAEGSEAVLSETRQTVLADDQDRPAPGQNVDRTGDRKRVRVRIDADLPHLAHPAGRIPGSPRLGDALAPVHPRDGVSAFGSQGPDDALRLRCRPQRALRVEGDGVEAAGGVETLSSVSGNPPEPAIRGGPEILVRPVDHRADGMPGPDDLGAERQGLQPDGPRLVGHAQQPGPHPDPEPPAQVLVKRSDMGLGIGAETPDREVCVLGLGPQLEPCEPAPGEDPQPAVRRLQDLPHVGMGQAVPGVVGHEAPPVEPGQPGRRRDPQEPGAILIDVVNAVAREAVRLGESRHRQPLGRDRPRTGTEGAEHGPTHQHAPPPNGANNHGAPIVPRTSAGATPGPSTHETTHEIDGRAGRPPAS